MRRRGGEPGIHCIAVHTDPRHSSGSGFHSTLSHYAQMDNITSCQVSTFLMAMASSKNIRFSLLRYSSVRYTPAVTKEQKQAIHAICSGSDVFVWLPTEFGKSYVSSAFFV